ncbi:MAG TPA: Hsp20/alpha crystallin family protein [Candidatus Acidoferrales bacterium]|jgi:HSP20 family protein|nr:Hsp20/alpha crystallin family protein [Candidatus Acidoferrales bacterium]
MATIARLEPFRGISTLQHQFNRLFNESFRDHGEESALTTWAPAVDIYETPNELVVKADLPDVNEKDIDVRVENNLLTIRGERKFEKSVSEENFLRVERTYGAFSRSFSLPNTLNAEAIAAEYRNGVLTITLPKREETKPRQVKVNVTSASDRK